MHSPLYSVSLLVLGLLAMGACGESGSLPEDPDRASPAGPSLATAASNSWSLKAALPTAAFAASAVSVTNGAGQSFVYAFGGRRNGEPDWPIEVYNVATDTWVARKTFADGSGMNGVVRIGNRLYYSGGWTTSDDRFGNASNHLFAYDFADDRLIQRADLPFHNAEGTSGAIGGKLYVLLGICSGEAWPAPGYCNGPGGLRRLYRYDPATNTWAARASAPHYHAGGGGAVLNGKFYVVAGEKPLSGPVSALDVYDPATNSWSTRAPLPAAGPATATVLKGKLFVVVNGGGTFSYDPGTDKWTHLATPQPAGPGGAYLSSIATVTIGGSSFVFGIDGHGLDDVTPNLVPSQLYTP